MIIQNKRVVIASSVLGATCAILIILLVYLIRVYRQKRAKENRTSQVEAKHPNIPPFIPSSIPDYPQPTIRDKSRDKIISDKYDPDKYGSPWTEFYKSSEKSMSVDNLNIQSTPSPAYNMKRRQRKWRSTLRTTIGAPSRIRRFRSNSDPYLSGTQSLVPSSSESNLAMDSDRNVGGNQQVIPDDTKIDELPLGKILVALCHNPSEGKLTITIKSAKDLPAISKSGKINPFVVIHVYTSGVRIYRRKTTIQRDTKTPNYEESFDFVVTRDKMPQTSVVLRLYHHGHRANVVTKNTLIGVVLMGYQFKLCGPHEYNLDAGARHWASVIEKPLLTIEEWQPVQVFF